MCVADVMQRWSHTLLNDDPWSQMPLDDATGVMRRVVSELVNESRDPDQLARRRRLVGEAAAHGAFRRRQEVRRADLLCDFAIALDAIAGALSASGVSPAVVRDTLAALDHDFNIAQEAALASWARQPAPSQPALDRWLERLLEQSD